MDATRAKVIGERVLRATADGQEPIPADVVELFVGVAINIARIAEDVAALKKDRLGS